uniref:GPS domain-containing protein n=1 Tax=Panagrellus redivivus TaxID=6233 RepID=A0A7E4VM59_PANRE
MTLVLLLALLHVSFLAMLCQATCTISGINVSEEIEDALKVEQLIGINDGQILKSMEGPNCNTAVGVEASLLLMDRKAGASEDCRLPTMQVSFPWLILTIATALVIWLQSRRFFYHTLAETRKRHEEELMPKWVPARPIPAERSMDRTAPIVTNASKNQLKTTMTSLTAGVHRLQSKVYSDHESPVDSTISKRDVGYVFRWEEARCLGKCRSDGYAVGPYMVQMPRFPGLWHCDVDDRE